MKYLSICSGIEAATVAWHRLGWMPVGFAEIDKFACAVLAERFGSNLPGEPLSGNGVPNFGDFTTIDLTQVGPVDLLVGGTPCQAFSFAGKRLSLADARGNLTLAYAVLAHELARSHGLRNAVWENVPGVLSTDDNAFGCFLGAIIGADSPLDLPKRIERWPDAGMVAGPRARAAWRLLDAQYFGLAQRRERVFVVVDFGNGADPAAVLFEPQGVQGNTAPSREAGEGVAPTLAARTRGGGGLGTDFDCDGGLVAKPLLAGGHSNNPLDENLIAGTLGCRSADHPSGLKSEADFLVPEIAATLTRGAESAGKGGYAGRRQEDDVNLVAFNNTGQGWWNETDRACGLRDMSAGSGSKEATVIAHTLRGEGFDASEDGTGRGIPLVPVYPIDMRQASRGDKFTNNRKEGSTGGAPGTGIGEDGDPSPTVAASHVPAVVFQPRFARNDRGAPDTIASALTAEAGTTGKGDSAQCVAYQLNGWAVRRLTTVECARLQGFPDHHSRIAWRGKPAEQCPDGPQYKTYGNSMAVECMAWLGRRFECAYAEVQR